MSIATRYSQSPTEETNSPTISLARREFAKTRRYAVSIGSPGHDDATWVVSASLDHPGRVSVSGVPRSARAERSRRLDQVRLKDWPSVSSSSAVAVRLKDWPSVSSSSAVAVRLKDWPSVSSSSAVAVRLKDWPSVSSPESAYSPGRCLLFMTRSLLAARPVDRGLRP